MQGNFSLAGYEVYVGRCTKEQGEQIERWMSDYGAGGWHGIAKYERCNVVFMPGVGACFFAEFPGQVFLDCFVLAKSAPKHMRDAFEGVCGQFVAGIVADGRAVYAWSHTPAVCRRMENIGGRVLFDQGFCYYWRKND